MPFGKVYVMKVVFSFSTRLCPSPALSDAANVIPSVAAMNCSGMNKIMKKESTMIRRNIGFLMAVSFKLM
jgi:hypothetical protein